MASDLAVRYDLPGQGDGGHGRITIILPSLRGMNSKRIPICERRIRTCVLRVVILYIPAMRLNALLLTVLPSPSIPSPLSFSPLPMARSTRTLPSSLVGLTPLLYIALNTGAMTLRIALVKAAFCGRKGCVSA